MALLSLQLVAEMDKRGIENHLVKGKTHPLCERCEFIGPVALDICRLALNMLRGRHSTDKGIQALVAVSAIDVQGLSPSIAQWLQYIIDKRLDSLLNGIGGDGIDKAMALCRLTFFKLAV